MYYDGRIFNHAINRKSAGYYPLGRSIDYAIKHRPIVLYKCVNYGMNIFRYMSWRSKTSISSYRIWIYLVCFSSPNKMSSHFFHSFIFYSSLVINVNINVKMIYLLFGMFFCYLNCVSERVSVWSVSKIIYFSFILLFTLSLSPFLSLWFHITSIQYKWRCLTSVYVCLSLFFQHICVCECNCVFLIFFFSFINSTIIGFLLWRFWKFFSPKNTQLLLMCDSNKQKRMRCSCVSECTFFSNSICVCVSGCVILFCFRFFWFCLTFVLRFNDSSSAARFV